MQHCVSGTRSLRTGILRVKEPKTINIRTLGPVTFTPSTRARRLSITVKSDLTIRVTVPEGASVALARRFLQSKIPWVKKSLKKLQNRRQDYPHTNLPAADRAKAKALLTMRLDYLARKYGFIYNRLFIRNQKTRWGTCSSKDNISLNVNLVTLPQELQDYVILHELVHTKHKNHGKEFWAAMNRLTGDGKKLQKQIRKYKPGAG